MGITAGITAGISAIGSIGSGIIGSNAYSDANSAAQSYLSQALAYEKGIYSDATTNLTPWITGGQEALGGLETFLGLGDSTGTGSGSGALKSYQDFTTTPYYTFPLQQTQQSMDQAAAAKGLSLSTGQLANLGKYASGYSAQNFGQYISALNNLSGSGQTAATNLGQIGSNISNQVSGTANQQASSASNSILGSASSWTNAISNLTSGLTNFANSTGSSYGGGSSSPAVNTTFNGYAPSLTPGMTYYGGYQSSAA